MAVAGLHGTPLAARLLHRVSRTWVSDARELVEKLKVFGFGCPEMLMVPLIKPSMAPGTRFSWIRKFCRKSVTTMFPALVVLRKLVSELLPGLSLPIMLMEAVFCSVIVPVALA